MSTWKVFQKPGIFVGHPDFADAQQFANRLAANKIGWCAVYVHQGASAQNVDWLDAHNWASIMRNAGITFGLWGYLSHDPVGEAKLASDLISHFDDPAHSTFYIADAEAEYTSWGGDITRSATFASTFRNLRPARPAALTSFGAATWDFSESTVFDFKPWQQNNYDFLPQCYFQQAAENEPAHCVEQAIAEGWPASTVHPIVGIYDDQLGRINGDQYSYLLRNCIKRFGTVGWSIYNAENVTDADLQALARLA
jgi:hypothetical protein